MRIFLQTMGVFLGIVGVIIVIVAFVTAPMHVIDHFYGYPYGLIWPVSLLLVGLLFISRLIVKDAIKEVKK